MAVATKDHLVTRGVSPDARRQPPGSRLDISARHVLWRALAKASPAEFASLAAAEVLAGTLKTGNHVCRPDVCHKGRIGKTGFCRMYFWHWVRRNVKKDETVDGFLGRLWPS